METLAFDTSRDAAATAKIVEALVRQPVEIYCSAGVWRLRLAGPARETVVEVPVEPDEELAS